MAFRPHGQGGPLGNDYPHQNYYDPSENHHNPDGHQSGVNNDAPNHGDLTSVYIGPVNQGEPSGVFGGPGHHSQDFGPNFNEWANNQGQGHQPPPLPPTFHPIPAPGPHFIALHGYRMRTVRSDDEERRILYMWLEPTGDQIHVPSGHPYADPALGPAMYYPAPSLVVVPPPTTPQQPHHQPTPMPAVPTQFYGPVLQNQPIWPQHGQQPAEPEIPICCAGNWINDGGPGSGQFQDIQQNQDPNVQHTDQAQGQFQPSGHFQDQQPFSGPPGQHFLNEQNSGQQNLEVSESDCDADSESGADNDYDGDISSGPEFESGRPAEIAARQEFFRLLENSGIVRSGDFGRKQDDGKC